MIFPILPILLFFLSFMAKSQSGDNEYYRLLGVSRTATQAEIKKSFRKLALKYHPDKHEGKDKEKANAMFSKIANAYDVLMDPKKREVYDREGEEGIKKYGQEGQHGQGGPFPDFFSFFQGHGGFFEGGGFGGNFGGFQREVNWFENSDVKTLDINTVSQFYRREEVWFIFYYKPEDANMEAQANLIKKLAQEQGEFKVGVVHCGQAPELCEEYSVFDTPKLLIFKQSIDDQGTPASLRSTIEELKNQAHSNMLDFVEIVTTDTLEEFLQRAPKKKKVIFFSDSEKGTPPMLKALSSTYNHYFVFGLVKPEYKSIMNQFHVSKLPSLVLMYDAKADPILFEGEPNSKQLIEKFLKAHKYEKQKEAAKEFRKLNKVLWDAGRCGAGDASMCFLYVSESANPTEDTAFSHFSSLPEYYQHDPVEFYYISLKEQPEFAKAFPKFSPETDNIILYKARRGKYGVLKNEITENNVKAFVDSVLGGSEASFKAREQYLEIKS